MWYSLKSISIESQKTQLNYKNTYRIKKVWRLISFDIFLKKKLFAYYN